jgi:glycosyltransferase involved in cell wall biosynthesis
VSLKVGINARLLGEPGLRGWNRYTVNLLAELPAQGVELYLYSDRPIHSAHLARLPEGSYQVRVQEGLRLPIWEHRWLPRQCGIDGVDLLHSTFNLGIPWSCPCPRVLTLHDAIDFIYYAPKLTWRQRLSRAHMISSFYHWIARTRAERIITVSEHARNDIVNFLGVPTRKVTVIPEAADPQFLKPLTDADVARVRSRHALPDRYVFYVGGWEGRKNVPFLLRGLAESAVPDLALVLAGGRAEQRAEFMRYADEQDIGNRLHLLEWVDDQDLPALYAGALCFAYPSMYEGFGLQLCEAMAAGCPTLAARATSLPEVLGNGGETFSLDSTTELANLIRRVALEPRFREGLVRKARTRASAFSWRKTAEAMADVYRELITRPSRHVDMVARDFL